MTEINLFQWLVEYQVNENLAKCLPHMDSKGRIAPPENKNAPVTEGLENKAYDGILILQNGNTLLERLVEEGRVEPEDIDNPVQVGSKELMFDFLSGRDDEDGVYVCETAKGEMSRVAKIEYPKHPLDRRIPLDFVYSDPLELRTGGTNTTNPWIETRKKIGTKTRLGIEMPASYNDVNACQIKRSGYTPLGMGKVTHFDNEGLAEEFFLKYNPSHQGPFIDKEHGIVGVYRRYEKRDNDLFKVEEKFIGPDLKLN